MEATGYGKIRAVLETRKRPAGRKVDGRKSNPRKERPLAQKQVIAAKWLAKNREDMFVCPKQPGQLMISRASCSKRYTMSRRENLKDFLKGDFFKYIYMRGLSVCRDCPIGKKLTSARPNSRSRPAARH
jgi:hypothetical protein